MQVFGFRARYRFTLNLSQLVSKLSAQTVLKRAITVHRSQIEPACFEAGQPAPKWATCTLQIGP